ncbi:OprD family outer membrane porin [Desulfopila sp. IMCC35008]|uniref:OprD family outer membrane porin n=1 Tax=Desulfopila sp. IMCC35008 TaxID=2653858 RepID=UPI0013D68F98|nr:OprD family outer membrane porin [Desulfopila sp. IMCC35008]
MKTKTIMATAVLFLCTVCGKVLADGPAQNPASLTDIITKGTLKATIKTLYYQHDFDTDTPDWSTLAIGGNLGFETAPLYGFSAGIGVKTSQGDLLDDDEVYRGLLAIGDTPEDDESYTELDEYFLRYSHWGTIVTFGAQPLNTPWVEGYDIRMTPKKYRGLTLQNNSLKNLELQGFYIQDWLDWTSEDWQSITAGLSGNEANDEGMIGGGAVWNAMDNLKLQVWDYYYNETLNNLYLRADYSATFGNDLTFDANIRYLDQSDAGEALAGALDTYQGGGEISLSGFDAKLSLYYGENGDDAIAAPFGGHKIAIMHVNNLSRAEEKIYAAKLSYSFKAFGAPGLSAYIFYGSFDTPDTGANASADIDEFNFDLQYTFGGWFEHCSVRLRHAIVDADESVGGEDLTDTRLYLVYKF